MFRRIIGTFFLALFFVPLLYVHAQTPTGGNFGSDVSVTASPENPGPGESVTLTLKSFVVDLKAATIEWRIDGKKSAVGVGADHFTFTTKELGSPTTISSYIVPVGSVPITKTVVITPMSVDILWQSTDSMVPPLYRGKALPSSESDIKFVAIPQVKDEKGNFVPVQNFIYTWQEDFNPDESASGYSIDSFKASLTYLSRSKSASVSVSTPDGSVTTKGSARVDGYSPKILWYAGSPLYGPLFDRALIGTHSVSGSDTTIIALPYFFSKKSPTSAALTYQWELNGEPLPAPKTPGILFLHRDTTIKGSASLFVSIMNPSRLFQEAESAIELSLE